MIPPTQLAQLICTRLCHDLAGPIGAVAAGVELIGDDPTMADPETLHLIASSSAAATQKLKFLRLAFGTAAQSSASALQECEVTARNYLSAIAGPGGTAALEWPPTAKLVDLQSRYGAAAIQVLVCTILVAIEAAPRARKLIVSIDPDRAEVRVDASGEAGAPIRRDIADVIADPDQVLTSARTAQALYWIAVCRDAGAAPAVDFPTAGVSVTARFPS